MGDSPVSTADPRPEVEQEALSDEERKRRLEAQVIPGTVTDTLEALDRLVEQSMPSPQRPPTGHTSARDMVPEPQSDFTTPAKPKPPTQDGPQTTLVNKISFNHSLLELFLDIFRAIFYRANSDLVTIQSTLSKKKQAEFGAEDGYGITADNWDAYLAQHSPQALLLIYHLLPSRDRLDDLFLLDDDFIPNVLYRIKVNAAFTKDNFQERLGDFFGNVQDATPRKRLAETKDFAGHNVNVEEAQVEKKSRDTYVSFKFLTENMKGDDGIEREVQLITTSFKAQLQLFQLCLQEHLERKGYDLDASMPDVNPLPDELFVDLAADLYIQHKGGAKNIPGLVDNPTPVKAAPMSALEPPTTVTTDTSSPMRSRPRRSLGAAMEHAENVPDPVINPDGVVRQLGFACA